MTDDWVLDVLVDLKSFAQQNGMFNLAEHLDDTLIVAAAELAHHGGEASKVSDGTEGRQHSRNVAAGEQPQ
ncbi:MAG: hypothetical protein AAGF71_07455 [Pseudomonadota bacterium]